MDASLAVNLAGRGAGPASRRGALRTLASGVALAAFRPDPGRAEAALPAAGSGDWGAVERVLRDAESTGGVVGAAVRGAASGLFARPGGTTLSGEDAAGA